MCAKKNFLQLSFNCYRWTKC